jgi:triosephosphate isomerase (TIM)
MPRVPVLAANWKMHKTIAETETFLDSFLPQLEELGGGPGREAEEPPSRRAEVVICPPYLALAKAVELSPGGLVSVAAQNMHEADSGAFTGELSAPMLLEIGVHGVILGHSERREHFGETDDDLARKLPAALNAGMRPILCVGEREAERDADETEAVLTRQIEADLADVAEGEIGDVVIAYEPIWAIGTGKTATPEQAQEAIALIRSLVAKRSAGAAEQVRILYGGSVKPDNAAELIGQPDVDGALVGGASLEPADFLAIVRAAS